MWRRLDEGKGGGPLFRVGGEVPKGDPSQAHGAPPPVMRTRTCRMRRCRARAASLRRARSIRASLPRAHASRAVAARTCRPPPQGAPAAVQQRGECEGEGAGHVAAPALALGPADPRPPSREAAPPERLDVDRRRATFICSVVMSLTKISN